MKILYLGEDGEHSTALHRAQTLMRLGHSVRHLNPRSLGSGSRWASVLHYRTGFRLLQNRALEWLDQQLAGERYHVVWVDSGAVWGPSAVRRMRASAHRVLNYNLDDPFGRRDGHLWDSYLRSIPEYDLLCVVRDVNVGEALALGARRVLRVWRGYDAIRHAPAAWSEEDARRWSSEVVFVGTWMPERGSFFATLAREGVPLTIRGNRWERAREWPALKPFLKGPGVGGDDYVKAIQYSKIALGLLSKGNRDLHTQRSAEIPYIGGLLCAERTPEHQQMFADDEEAVLWGDAQECAQQCRRLLADETLRRRIALAGRKRVLRSGYSNDEVVAQILHESTRGAEEGQAPTTL